MSNTKKLNADESKLLDAAVYFYTRRSAAREIMEMTRPEAAVVISDDAMRGAFAVLDSLLSLKSPENWPGLAGAYRDLIAFAIKTPRLRVHLAESGVLIRSFRAAAQQAAAHEKLVICSTFMEFAKRDEAESWHKALARQDGIPAALGAATSSLTTYTGRPVDEFFRFAEEDVEWSRALAAKDVFLCAIESSSYKMPLAMDMLQKAAGNPLVRQSLIESGSLAQIYTYFKKDKGIVPFQIQCVRPWAQALWPHQPTPFAGAKHEPVLVR